MSGAEMEKMRQWDLEMNPVLEIPLPAGEATIRTGGGGDGESARETFLGIARPVREWVRPGRWKRA
eukprot:scaffold103347_cov21-Tisochrysis_lutea.AAC.1